MNKIITIAIVLLLANVIPNNARGLPADTDEQIQDFGTIDATSDCEMLTESNDKGCIEINNAKDSLNESNETASDSFDLGKRSDKDTALVTKASQRRSRVLNMSSVRQASNGIVERVVRMVRGMMGLPRNESSRFTRHAIGVMTGHSQCRQKIVCQFGKMFSGFKDADMIFGFIEHISPTMFKKTCGIMRRAAAKIEDCTNYLCDV